MVQYLTSLRKEKKTTERKIIGVNLGVFQVQVGLLALRTVKMCQFVLLDPSLFSLRCWTCPQDSRHQNSPAACSFGRIRSFRFCSVYIERMDLWLPSWWFSVLAKAQRASWLEGQALMRASSPPVLCIFFGIFMVSLSFAVLYCVVLGFLSLFIINLIQFSYIGRCSFLDVCDRNSNCYAECGRWRHENWEF